MAHMEVALGVWICTLPFIFLLLAPWLGFKAAGGTALFLLLVITEICWFLCSARARTRVGRFRRLVDL